MSYIKSHSSPCKLVEIAKEQVLCLKVMFFFLKLQLSCAVFVDLFLL